MKGPSEYVRFSSGASVEKAIITLAGADEESQLLNVDGR